jgi:hypothetical protein
MANGHGGVRPGSGRKSNAERFRLVREAMEVDLERIYRESIPQALQELVAGHYREETNKDGTTRIYSVSPNVTAIQEVLNRLGGRPEQHVELTGQDGGPIEIQDARIRLLGIVAKFVEEQPDLRIVEAERERA